MLQPDFCCLGRFPLMLGLFPFIYLILYIYIFEMTYANEMKYTIVAYIYKSSYVLAKNTLMYRIGCIFGPSNTSWIIIVRKTSFYRWRDAFSRNCTMPLFPEYNDNIFLWQNITRTYTERSVTGAQIPKFQKHCVFFCGLSQQICENIT